MRETETIGRFLGAGMLALALTGTPARATILINPQGWKFPNIMNAEKGMIRPSDRTPLIPGKETLLKGYKKADGTFFMTYEIEGRVFGVQVDTDGKPPFEYGLMDTDGDGIFETKIVPEKGGKDQGYVPMWIIDYYYSKHPELKRPDGVVRPAPPVLGTTTSLDDLMSAPKASGTPPPEILSQPSP